MAFGRLGHAIWVYIWILSPNLEIILLFFARCLFNKGGIKLIRSCGEMDRDYNGYGQPVTKTNIFHLPVVVVLWQGLVGDPGGGREGVLPDLGLPLLLLLPRLLVVLRLSAVEARPPLCLNHARIFLTEVPQVTITLSASLCLSFFFIMICVWDHIAEHKNMFYCTVYVSIGCDQSQVWIVILSRAL